MQRWVGAKILVALGMLTSLVFGIVGLFQEDRTPPRWSLEGLTDQGYAIHMDIDEQGKLRTFDTRGPASTAAGRGSRPKRSSRPPSPTARPRTSH